MKTIKLITIATVAFMLFSSGPVFARGGGGGFHEGGGGGWSGGGRGGGGGERSLGGGGSFERGGDRPGEHGSGEYHGDRWDGHRRNNNNNNNNNTTTNNYTANVDGWDGGWGYGAADEALAGMMMGTMMGTMAVAAASQPSTVVVEQPTTVVQQVVPAALPVGAQVTTLPGVCSAVNVNNVMAYQCGTSWYRPFFGANGVYYQVVPPPPANAGSAARSIRDLST